MRPFIYKPEKDNTTMVTPLAEDELSEIFVVGYQDPTLGSRFVKQIFVRSPFRIAKDRKDFVTLITKPFSDRRSAAFIDQKAHFRRSPQPKA